MIRDEQASIFTPDTARDDRIAVGPAARPMSRPVRTARPLATRGLTSDSSAGARPSGAGVVYKWPCQPLGSRAARQVVHRRRSHPHDG